MIATRADPALPLARLRARGELVEIRAADLRFTPDEAAAYLNEVMGLDLTAPDVAALEGRTEGWIAALQLAALSMQGRDDIAGFIAGFAGDDRYIVDYLVEEVLQRQPERVRSFLLETSILARMTGPLCDAVTGQDDGKAMLEALDRRNLFLVPLDDRRRWYRYHHLFADVLRAHLLDEQPDLVPELHRRACDWYEQNGERPEAIGHALAAGDLERAADLVELAIPALSRGRQEATLRRWLEALPDELLRMRPVLSDAYAGSILVRGEVEGVEERLRDAERWLDADDEATMAELVRWSWSTRRRFVTCRARSPCTGPARPGSSAMWPGPSPTPAGRSTSSPRTTTSVGVVGPRSWPSPTGRTGISRPRSRSYAAGMANLEKAGHLSDVIGCALALADIRLAQGRLGEALRVLERGLALATGQGGHVLRGAADMHVGISAILLERDDLEARPAPPVRGRGAGRGERPAAEPLPVARRHGRDPAGRRRPRRRARAPRRGRASFTWGTSRRTSARSPP